MVGYPNYLLDKDGHIMILVTSQQDIVNVIAIKAFDQEFKKNIFPLLLPLPYCPSVHDQSAINPFYITENIIGKR